MTPNIKAEYEALQKSAALLNFSGNCRFEILGTARVSFLHNILTQDIKSLKPGQAARSCLLNAQGKILADMQVYVFEDRIILDAEAMLENKIPEILEKYVITEDVTIRNVSSELSHIAVEGPMSQNFKIIPAGMFPQSWTGNTGFHLLVSKEEAKNFTDTLLKKGVLFAGIETFEIARIAAGHLRYGIDMDETITLPETGLDLSAASETKGCYPGQEVVARTNTYKGHQKKMGRIIFEGNTVPKRGEKIYNAENIEAGWVTSACILPDNREIPKIAALAYLKKGFFENPVTFYRQSGEMGNTEKS